MGRSSCCEKVGLKKGPWAREEDQKLLAYIEEHGHGSWRALPAKAGLQRCGKSCRLRWTNYLRPDVKRGNFTLREEQTIIQLHALLGNRWSAIAVHLPKRTDNEIKNYWNTHLKKRLIKMGIDPITHRPMRDAPGWSGRSKDAANLSHVAQWENARLEAEARLVRARSKLVAYNPYQPQLGSLAPAPNPVQLLNKATAHARMPPCVDVLKAWQGTWTNPTKDGFGINILNNYSIFSTNETLESPTSILNFSDYMINNILTPSGAIGYVANSHVGAMNYTENPGAIDATYNIADMLRIPSFTQSCTNDLRPEINDDYDLTNARGQSENDGGGDIFDEKKINYWNDLMNLVTAPLDSPFF